MLNAWEGLEWQRVFPKKREQNVRGGSRCAGGAVPEGVCAQVAGLLLFRGGHRGSDLCSAVCFSARLLF